MITRRLLGVGNAQSQFETCPEAEILISKSSTGRATTTGRLRLEITNFLRERQSVGRLA